MGMDIIKEKWISYSSDLEYNIINELTIDSILDKFKQDVIEKLDNDTSILLQLKICSLDKSVYRSISTIDRYTKSEFGEVYDIFKSFWDLQMDEYIDIVNEPRIVISYNIIPSEYNINNTKILRRKNNQLHTYFNNYDKNNKIKGYNLPNTMDYREWGSVKLDPCKTKVIVIKNSKVKYEIEIKDKELNRWLINNRARFKDVCATSSNLSNILIT